LLIEASGVCLHSYSPRLLASVKQGWRLVRSKIYIARILLIPGVLNTRIAGVPSQWSPNDNNILAIRQGILPYLFPNLERKLSKAQEGDVAVHLPFQVPGLMNDDKVTRINAKRQCEQ
jgi:hypothetical protein